MINVGKFTKVVVISCLSFGLAAASPAMAAKQPAALTVSAGAMGQTWYMLAAHLGEKLKKEYAKSQITVMAGGGLSNVKLVEQGVVDFAMTSTTLYSAAIQGKKPFKKKYKNMMGIANFQAPSAFYFMVEKSKNVKSIDEFIQKKMPLRLCTFKKSGPPAVSVIRLLAEYGVTDKDVAKWGGKVNYMQWRDCVSLGRDGHIDAMIGTTSLPSPNHAELASARDMELLPVPADKVAALKKKYGYLDVIIPKGTFSGLVKKDLPVFGYYGYVVARRQLSNDVAYNMARFMYESDERIRRLHKSFQYYKPEKLTLGIPGPIHPGAIRFYKEKGILK